MINEREYRELTAKVATAMRVADRARGALDREMATLREEFGCKTLAAAKVALAKAEKEATKLERIYVQTLKTFRQQWDGILDKLEGES